jgi:hypothetical protein
MQEQGFDDDKSKEIGETGNTRTNCGTSELGNKGKAHGNQCNSQTTHTKETENYKQMTFTEPVTKSADDTEPFLSFPGLRRVL